MANQLVNLNISGIKELSAMQQLLSPKAFDKTLRSGIRYAAKSVPPATGKAISARYTISSSRVKQATSPPLIRGEGEALEATLRFSRKPPTALQFKPRRRGPNLVHSLIKGQTTYTPHGFIGTANGQRLPLYPDRSKPYTPDLGTGRRTPRAALGVIHGPSIGSIFLGKSLYGEQIRSDVRGRIAEQFAKGVERQLKAATRGFG
jgi:hypothetical protein